ncbi:Polyphenol oxidase [bioreactor metagenome]|uniref:Polyphenol oxidase n=1 Tax=bioreactor metagenome TaxID=1076179 RepID=A0A644T118_9ZZZZ|nr:peptidoglycan editing factor PgeF [Negativicutes bacterium]
MSDFFITKSPNGVKFGQFKHLCDLPVRHGISTRIGGISQAPYAKLNLGLHTGDDSAAVNTNRQLFCDAVGVEFCKIVTAEQTHGDHIMIVTDCDAGKGHALYNESIKDTDALITNITNIPLMLFFADCVPIIIVDPIRKVVAVSHAGWKGTVAKIAQKTVLKMQDSFGSIPSDCQVGIGPSIGSCCYEVDQTVITHLKQNFSNWRKLVKQTHEAHWQLDLWLANKFQLEEVGVKTTNIIISDLCTACNTDLFFSHRAEQGRTGRLGAVVSLI